MLLVHEEWPSLPPSVLVAKATACHPPSGLISPWWMTISRSRSEVSPLKKRTQTLRNAWSSSKTRPAQGTITAAQPLKWCQMIFSSLTPHYNSSKLSSTMVLSNPLAGGRLLPLLRERLAILHRLRLGTNCKSATHNSRIQRLKLPVHFQGAYFGKPLTTRFFSGILPTLLHETRGCFVPLGLVQ